MELKKIALTNATFSTQQFTEIVDAMAKQKQIASINFCIFMNICMMFIGDGTLDDKNAKILAKGLKNIEKIEEINISTFFINED